MNPSTPTARNEPFAHRQEKIDRQIKAATAVRNAAQAKLDALYALKNKIIVEALRPKQEDEP